MKLLNLDKFVNEDRFFKVSGMEFRVPGLIPLETVLRISKLGQEVSADTSRVNDVMSEVWGVLAPVNADKTEADLRAHISAPMLGELLPFIFNDQGGEDVDTGVVDLSKNGSGGVEPSAK